MDTGVLFLGATVLTAVTDNAALTYLGSQIEEVTAAFQYALVAGAVAGGGLTVIANAPNPVAFSVLQDRFGNDGINPLKLIITAAVPTLVAMAALWFL
jgi:Na+/H+ antiporter NhaD/arsenite permease-like protein